MTWTHISNRHPVEGRIVFIARPRLTDEEIGIAVPEQEIVLLKRTDMAFSDLLYFIEIPEPPEN
jgi:hypothetical protein